MDIQYKTLGTKKTGNWKLALSVIANAALFTGLCVAYSKQSQNVAFAPVMSAQTIRTPTMSTGPARDVRVGAESRRGMMAGIGGVAAAGVLSQFKGAQAAYGDPANVFGKTTNPKGFIPTKRDEYSFLLPSKWLYSSERDFDGITERYQDNFDAVNFAAIIKKDASGKNSIDQLGSPEDFLKSQTYLFGQQAWTGETKSEGGFKPGAVAAVSLLDYGTKTDKKGTKYYEYELLSRTADGDEGGRHKLITAGVKNGQLFVLYIQVGDKRWFKGVDKEALGLRDSFTLA